MMVTAAAVAIALVPTPHFHATRAVAPAIALVPTPHFHATRAVAPQLTAVNVDEYLCLASTCAPVADWFDGPLRAKQRWNWAMPRNPRKLKPSWAQLFARRTRIRLSSLSPEKVTVLGAIINIILAAVKLGVGSLVGSAVLLADGWHSLGDLVSDVLCMVAVKIGARPPTPRHPNGFRKIEHVLSLGIAAILASGGVAMTWSSLGALRSTPLALTGRASLAATDLAALSVAVVSVLSKELLFGVTHAIGLRNRSPSIIANAYHHRSDALSSLIAIVGIAGALCGCAWLDPFAATAVGLMVTWMGREVSRESIAELMAPPVTTLPEEQSAPTEPEDPELAADAPPLRANSPLSGSVHPVAAAQSVGAGGSGGAAGRQAGRAQPTSASRRTAPSPRMGMPRMLVRTSVSRPSPRTGTPRMLVSKLPMAIAGGAAAGGLHAISGPDHLAALLPLCLGRRWYLAATTGAIWGLGHGVGAALVGLLGFALRGTLNLDALSGYMEAAVGISIIIIGATGLIEACATRPNARPLATVRSL
jgi:cation diffusion facilitator family transporter